MTLRVGWALVAFGLLGSCAPVTTGMLRGTLTVPRSSRAEDAVVWLEKLPDPLARASARRSTVKSAPRSLPSLIAKNQSFDPRLVVLAAGDTLVFRNEDRVWHGLFSVSRQSPFDLGKRAPGQVDSITFAKPGQVQVRCDIHPGMSATVLVLPNRAFTRPNAAGEWRMPGLQEGAYVVHAWAPGLRELRKDAVVIRRGEAVLQLHW